MTSSSRNCLDIALVEATFCAYVKEDIFNYVCDFYTNANLPKAVSSSFLALIPKVSNPRNLSEFRPICLVGCLYKIIAKVLANRLKRVVDKLISKTQTAFIPGRHIQDGMVVLNEVVDFAKRNKRSCLVLKVDFEKAYDNVNWSFLLYMLSRFGFGEKWLRWMKACICSSSMSVLVNGSPTKDFMAEKGLKQGDPLSPFLFTIVTEGLARMVAMAKDRGVFSGFRVSQNLSFELMQFADDTVIIGEGSWSNLWSIKAILRGFELASGLPINLAKSSILGVNLEESFMLAAADFLCCRRDRFPSKFLGILLGDNHRQQYLWKSVVEKMRSSDGGDDYVAERVLVGRGSRKENHFVVSWEDVCRDKADGGLGVRNIEMFNVSLLNKWRWRFLVDTEAVWRSLLVHIYGPLEAAVFNGKEYSRSGNNSLWWRDIRSLSGQTETMGDWFQKGISCRVGTGSRVLFWKCKWCGSIPFQLAFPTLFSISSQQNATVANMGKYMGDRWLWSYHEEFAGQNMVVQEELAELSNILAQVCPDRSLTVDGFKWFANGEGRYVVSEGYRVMDKTRPAEMVNEDRLEAYSILWQTRVPSKIHVFGWRCIKNRLPTYEQLMHRGVSHCGFGETLDHLFVCKLSFCFFGLGEIIVVVGCAGI
ncbi:uncharacterized protein LOC131605811 [Vicia villosa]|uniref:uncharacterized protein LOC131605811 n=1 Tax=Vicia villosa TaxID=3911 RepID=UPI00273B4A5D|nr:uncharacterized protein LOC131605811 [Vicia villosa]